jgi:hypothetical protein
VEVVPDAPAVEPAGEVVDAALADGVDAAPVVPPDEAVADDVDGVVLPEAVELPEVAELAEAGAAAALDVEPLPVAPVDAVLPEDAPLPDEAALPEEDVPLAADDAAAADDFAATAFGLLAAFFRAALASFSASSRTPVLSQFTKSGSSASASSLMARSCSL